ncbi:DeoR family transcriptional regulator [Murinocardiopsis flavida]|uniref:DeoR family transcriptional regulator n=1 Tax=Murinocardiopsis flavida TaxID=645275 RepID=A0A2P8D518_9ACTN|nr:DeoR/GlpR family DNA-binding transcription regulator [Murinocardiopsis flavida]PSK92299.1 DeoR family transcriptional regulator [Murinocardiopsis flavida]
MARYERLFDAVVDGVQRVEDLAVLLEISPSTVRRALTELEQAGRVVRTHGGAVPVPAGAAELSWTDKQRRNAPAKRAIADHAAGLVDDDHVVILDAGSTTTFIAERLAERSGLAVITNGMGPMIALQHAEGVDLTVVGGRLRRRRGSLVGDHARAVLERVTADIVFVGVDGLDPGRGLNCPNPEIGGLKELLMRSARRTVLVTDSAKVGAAPFHHWALIPGPYTLVTDSAISDDARAALDADPQCESVVLPPRTSP